MTAPHLECFDCMAAAAGAHWRFSAGCSGCAERLKELPALIERDPAIRDSVDPLWFDTLPIQRENAQQREKAL